MNFFSFQTVYKIRSSPVYLFFCLIFIWHAIFSIAFSPSLPFGVQLFSSKWHSMEPFIKPGSLLIVQKRTEYTVNDVITYYANINNQQETVTHRIYQIGGNVYVTKGDANEAIDRQIVIPRLIIGKVIGIIPYFGSYGTFLKSAPGHILFITIPFIVILNIEIFKLISLYRSS